MSIAVIIAMQIIGNHRNINIIISNKNEIMTRITNLKKVPKMAFSKGKVIIVPFWEQNEGGRKEPGTKKEGNNNILIKGRDRIQKIKQQTQTDRTPERQEEKGWAMSFCSFIITFFFNIFLSFCSSCFISSSYSTYSRFFGVSSSPCYYLSCFLLCLCFLCLRFPLSLSLSLYLLLPLLLPFFRLFFFIFLPYYSCFSIFLLGVLGAPYPQQFPMARNGEGGVCNFSLEFPNDQPRMMLTFKVAPPCLSPSLSCGPENFTPTPWQRGMVIKASKLHSRNN